MSFILESQVKAQSAPETRRTFQHWFFILSIVTTLGFLAPRAQAMQQKDFAFAQKQLQRFENLLGELNERAQEENDLREISKFKLAIKILDRRISETQESLERAQAQSDNSFLLEHLRESVLELQEAGSRALGRAIDADQTNYDFKVSRTGQ
jgi:hypothetical protein